MFPFLIFSIDDPYYIGVFYVMSALVGLCVGSFLNVVIYRVPNGLSVAKPASHCPNCGYVLKWYDNIPVISYITLGGKCRSCKKPISFHYTMVELAGLILWLLSALLFRQNIGYAVITMAASAVCVCVTFIDLENMMIPDRFQVVMLVLAILATLFDTQAAWWSHLIGLGAAAVIFIGVSLIVSAVMKREALGGGDIKFAICAGLFLGWERFLIMLLVAAVSASVVMIVRTARRGGESLETPFAPFLCGGFLVAVFAGTPITQAYLSLLVR